MTNPALAPDLRQPRIAGPLTVYAACARPALFYYPPGDLAVASRADGAPDLHLLHARYTGSAATGDRGTAVVRSILTLRVIMSGPTLAQIADARRALAAAIGGSIELRPLPIRRLEAAIVYTPIESSESSASRQPTDTPSARPGTDAASPAPLPAGHFEAGTAAAPRDGYWTERVYTLGLGPADAQLLADALTRGRLALSVGYAFLAEGIGPETPLQELSGSPALVDALKALIDRRAPSSAAPAATTDRPADAPLHVVRAGAIGVTADVMRWPSIVRRVDINDAVPPGYAALDIYCYDFNQDTADSASLYEKQVEIQADGVGGRPVTLTATFTRAHPDLYARSLRFPVAVRLDRPYRVRVTRVTQDGTSTTTAWREQSSWSALLDVTAQGAQP